MSVLKGIVSIYLINPSNSFSLMGSSRERLPRILLYMFTPVFGSQESRGKLMLFICFT